MVDLFTSYVKALQSYDLKDITEHTHRSILENLLKSVANQKDSKIQIQHEPKREIDLGAPDFKVTKDVSIIGYIENKKIDENLDKVLKSDQIKRYKELSNNILLTNYIEWIWIRNGEVIKRETLCYKTDLENKRFKPDEYRAKEIINIIKNFFSQPPIGLSKAKDLADALAVRGRWLRNFLVLELNRQQKQHKEGKLFGLFATFRINIHYDLSLNEFADAYAQTLVYGLFLAKLNAEDEKVSLYNAKKFIPVSFELIKELVDFIDELEKDEYKEVKWLVEEVLSIMNNLNLKGLLQTLSFKNRPIAINKEMGEIFHKDPYVYFYENFLASYDKKLRKSKGVYYTPPPVVDFIIRAIDDILVNTFEIRDGFADRKEVTVLDFATGTGTFLLEIFENILGKPAASGGRKQEIIKEHILKNLFGLEFMIGPYTVAHLKLSQFLKDNGYKFEKQDRLKVYLTNTLEPIKPQHSVFIPAIFEEGIQAKAVKERDILVITGNPPYSGHSQNPSKIDIIKTEGSKTIKKSVLTWIGKLIEDYKYIDGKLIDEKVLKWLHDDYVKFIRFAQYKMEKVDQGIIGIITNHSYLDNPTFRGMRYSLMKEFDHIYIIDLHGSTKKQEKTPLGEKDENVFDIEQGVAISIFVKKKGLEKKILYEDFFGSRDEKYYRCATDSIKNINWKTLSPIAPYYTFTPQDYKLKREYDKGFSVNDMFKTYSVGIVTARDKFTIRDSKNDVKKVISDFIKMEDEVARDYFQLGKDVRDWKVNLAKKDIIDTNANENNIIQINYRPFDTKWTYYTGKSKGFHCMPRGDVMRHLLNLKNIALVTTRQTSIEEWNHCFISDKITESCFVSNKTSEIGYVFPLSLDSNFSNQNSNLFDDSDSSNFTNKFIDFIHNKYNIKPQPIEIMGYIYSILNCPSYKLMYNDFLKGDFPKIPFPEKLKGFTELSKLGSELIYIHLMDKERINISLKLYSNGEYRGDGDNEVLKVEYKLDKKSGNFRIYINESQFFDCISENLFEFHIGSYRVLEKYLKSRKGKKLILDEIEYFENLVKVIAFTIDHLKKLDKEYKNWF